MPNTALITGASSGIGREFARYHASKGGDVIITARRGDALQALKAELESAHKIAVYVIPADLGADDGAHSLIAAVNALQVQVDVLINNAGFGGHGLHVERDLADEQAMIDLNVKALVTLSHHFGALMAQGAGGKILNVASTAAMMPGPLQAIYFATKAFVMSYSQALDEELRAKGVTVTSLNPGYVHTEFAAVADLDGTDLVKQKGATAESVAQFGYDAMLAGKLVVVNEWPLRIMTNWIIPLLPRRMVLKIIRKMQTK